jgi:hypothetical protein
MTKAPNPTDTASAWSAQSGLSDPFGQPGASAALGVARGPQGVPGPQGNPGTNGTNGSNGAAGATGPAGPSVVPSGATGSRTATPATGAVFLDTTLGIPVFFNGTNWVNSAGATV